jgi:hypothetical protein
MNNYITRGEFLAAVYPGRLAYGLSKTPMKYRFLDFNTDNRDKLVTLYASAYALFDSLAEVDSLWGVIQKDRRKEILRNYKRRCQEQFFAFEDSTGNAVLQLVREFDNFELAVIMGDVPYSEHDGRVRTISDRVAQCTEALDAVKNQDKHK